MSLVPNTRSQAHTQARSPQRWRAVVAAMTATVLALLGIQSAAVAAVTEGGVTLTVDYGGETYDGTTVVTPGTPYSATLSYSIPALAHGDTVTVTVPDGVEILEAGLAVPPGNTVVDSLELDGDGNLVVTFADPIVSDNDQGFVGFGFQFDALEEGTGVETVTWLLGESEDSVTLIVREPGDEFRPDLSHHEGKSVAGHTLNDFVTYDDGVVTLDPDVVDATIGYVLRIESADARQGVEIVDTISDYLAHIESSVMASLTTWDEDGFNQITESFTLPSGGVTGQVLTIDNIDIPANSVLEIRYNAQVTDVAGLKDALQAAADGVDPDDGGNYSVTLTNDADIDGAAVSGSSSIGGWIAPAPRPGLGNAFGKSVSPSSELEIEVDDEGDLVDPIDVTYSFSIDLTEFADFDDTAWELDRNVVITDTLPAGITWGTISSDDVTLTDASAVCVAADDFSADECVNQYRVDGQVLEINVGSDTSTQVTIEATAVINSLEQLPVNVEPSWRLTAQAIYTARNDAFFDYSDSRDPHGAHASRDLVLPKPPGSIIDDPGVFNKTTESSISLQPGESVNLPYAFTLAAGAVPDLTNTRLIDVVDTTVFDVSDLSVIQDSITGSYDHQGSLSGSDFDLELVDDELVFTLSDTFGSDLPDWLTLTDPLTERLVMNFELPTHVLQGKQTLQVENSARVEGDDDESYVWVSQASGSATTYGDELEVSKLLYAGNDSWSRNMRVELDENGELVTNEFIYRIELIPHGDFSGFAIMPLADTLPEGTRFEGFVNDGDIDAGTPHTSTTVDMGGNIEAEWVEDENTIHIAQQPGTVLPPGSTIAANFMVTVTEFTEDVGITNSISSASATLTPSNGYPLVILKQDSQRDYMTITDRDARFTVTGPDGDVVTDQAYVVNGQLMVAGEDGADAGVVVPADPDQPDVVPAGDYTITETRAPAGYELASEPIIARIGEDGGSNPVTFFNDPAPLYAIGDYVWIDVNDDGQQGTDEPPLPDVTVELLDPATGDVLATTHTDVNGRYVFDLLPAGDYRVRFILTPDQANVYTLTEPDRGGDQTADSDAARATGETAIITLGPDNEYLVDGEDYEHGDVQAFLGIDPTWDAGVVLRPGTVAVGDYVWVDENKDGRQDTNEPGIPGVTLVLTGPDGEPVIDVDGREVVPQVTDDKGRYLFPHLPVLEEGESYTVTIDQEASADALAPYLPTIPGQGNRAGDSSDWTASSEGLTVAGEVDLTLDFGFVLIPVEPPVEPVTEGGAISDVEEPDVQDDGLLSRTGAEVTALVAASAILLLLGAAFVMWRRRLTA